MVSVSTLTLSLSFPPKILHTKCVLIYFQSSLPSLLTSLFGVYSKSNCTVSDNRSIQRMSQFHRNVFFIYINNVKNIQSLSCDQSVSPFQIWGLCCAGSSTTSFQNVSEAKHLIFSKPYLPLKHDLMISPIIILIFYIKSVSNSCLWL